MSMIEDMRKVLQDFLAPELRSISVRMESLEKQSVEDKTDILRVIAEGNADTIRMIVAGKEDTLRQIAESKADTLRAIADSTAHMEKRFEMVIDYTKVLQRTDKLEESRQAGNH